MGASLQRGAIIVVLVASLAAGARAQTGGGYDLTWNRIAGGGGDSSAGDLMVSGTIGQADAGFLHGGDFELLGGFWAVAATAPPLACRGDCGPDGQVTVDDLVAMVNIALGNAAVATCTAGDGNADGQITVDEILVAVNNALSGCPNG